ncbi:hypothetical protein [Burkholderia cenocepacia]|uniref:hypothetical protein n=1 Tax=Burkholderia cenocepacia TaxID=95486 RepID=UPI0006AC995F|nr:hypothetical protein [Burkholderia cenocepacia]KOR22971.1 hypothetical protein ABW54_04040 [Burkholderia cenocepacia]
MGEREMFGAALAELATRDEESFEKPFPDDDLNALWAIWQAARRTTPDREAIIQGCIDTCAAEYLEDPADTTDIAYCQAVTDCIDALHRLKTSDKGGA